MRGPDEHCLLDAVPGFGSQARTSRLEAGWLGTDHACVPSHIGAQWRCSLDGWIHDFPSNRTGDVLSPGQQPPHCIITLAVYWKA